MADDILGNISNMNIDELGSSVLLQEHETTSKAAAKKMKNEKRVQQGLTLLLMGQGETQLKKRIKAEDFHKFDTLNAEDKAKKLNVNATTKAMCQWDKGGYEGLK